MNVLRIFFFSFLIGNDVESVDFGTVVKIQAPNSTQSPIIIKLSCCAFELRLGKADKSTKSMNSKK